MSHAATVARSSARLCLDHQGKEVFVLSRDNFQAISERLAMTDKLVDLLQDYKPNVAMTPQMRSKFMLLMEWLEP